MRPKPTRLPARAAVLAAVGGLLLTACADNGGSPSPAATTPDDQGTASAELEPISLTIGYIPAVTAGGVPAIANELGLWEQYGLEVELIEFNNGPLQVQAMSSGDLDIGYLGAGALWAPADGLATVITMSDQSWDTFLISQPGSGIESAEDLAGARVGVTEGTSAQLLLDEALSSAGLTNGDIDLVAMDPPTAVTAFVSGDIDVAAIFLPFSNEISRRVPEANLFLSTRDFPENVLPGAYIASNELVADNPEAVLRFLRVFAEANDIRSANQDDAVNWTADFSGTPADTLGVQYEAVDWPTSDEILAFHQDGDLDGWLRNLQEFFVSIERLETVVDPDDFMRLDLFDEVMAEQP